MSEKFYQASQHQEIGQSQKPKNFIVIVLLTWLASPFVAMLHLARPVRALIYLIIDIALIFTLVSGIGGIDSYVLFALRIGIIVVALIDAWQIRKHMSLDKLLPLYSRAYVLIPGSLFLLLSIYSIRGLFVDYYHLPAASMLPNYKPGDYIVVDKSKSAQNSFAGIPISVKPSEAMYEMVRRGNVIVFYKTGDDEQVYVKRIIGIPNDVITFNGHEFSIENCLNNKCVSIPTKLNHIGTYEVNLPGRHAETVDASLYKETTGGLSFDVLHSLPNEYGSCVQLPQSKYVVPEGYVFVMGDYRDNSFDSRFFGPVEIINIVGEVL